MSTAQKMKRLRRLKEREHTQTAAPPPPPPPPTMFTVSLSEELNRVGRPGEVSVPQLARIRLTTLNFCLLAAALWAVLNGHLGGGGGGGAWDLDIYPNVQIK